LGDGHGARADVAGAGRQGGPALQALEADVLDRQLEVEPRGDLRHQIHVEAGVLAVLLELEGRVRDVRADREGPGLDEAEAGVVTATVTAAGVVAAAAGRQGQGGGREKSERKSCPHGSRLSWVNGSQAWVQHMARRDGRGARSSRSVDRRGLDPRITRWVPRRPPESGTGVTLPAARVGQITIASPSGRG